MGRYRPPQAWGSPYITPEGEQRLREELDQLWRVERPQITEAVHEAAKNGDRSENGDYIYNKRRLREIDRRVRYLSKRLPELQVIRDKPANLHKIYFGATVELENNRGDSSCYRIVGPDEFDPGCGLISIDAPLARKLIGKQVDDEITMDDSEQGSYVVTAIRYEQPRTKALKD